MTNNDFLGLAWFKNAAYSKEFFNRVNARRKEQAFLYEREEQEQKEAIARKLGNLAGGAI